MDELYNEELEIFEAIQYDKIQYRKLNKSGIYLPRQKIGCYIELLGNDLSTSLDLLRTKSILLPPNTYMNLHSHPITRISAFGRTYRNTRNLKSIRKLAADHKLIVQLSLPQQSCFVDMTEVMNAFNNNAQYRSFGAINKDFISFLINNTPKQDKVLKGDISPKYIYLFNAEDYAFDRKINISRLKTNPLFHLYYLIINNKDKKNGFKQFPFDIIIADKNQSYVFNPNNIDSKLMNIFKQNLFILMKTNLDVLIQKEKEQIDDTDNYVPTTVSQKVSVGKDDILQIDPLYINTFDDSDNELIHSVNQQINQNNKLSRLDILDNDLTQSEELEIDKEELTSEEIDSEEDITDIIDALSNNPEKVEIEEDSEEIKTTEDQFTMDELNDIVKPKIRQYVKKIIEEDSARDKELKAKQDKIIIRGDKSKSFKALSEIKIIDKEIEISDHSTSQKNINPNLKEGKFENYHSNYIDKYMDTDIINVLKHLNQTDNRFYIENINIIDTSDSLNYIETWEVSIRDNLNHVSVMKFQVPKFIDGKFLFLQGNKKVLMNQNMMLPLSKTGPDVCQMVSNYNKIFVRRYGSRNTIRISKILKLSNNENFKKYFKFGNSTVINIKYISSLEYDEIGKSILMFSNGTLKLFFNRELTQLKKIKEMYNKKLQDNEFIIGKFGDEVVICNSETGKTNLSDTIIELIYNNLSNDAKLFYDSIKEGKQYLYAFATIASKKIPCIFLMGYWEGIESVLNKANIQYRFDNTSKKANNNKNENVIQFQDGFFYYNASEINEMILNALKSVNTKKINFVDLNNKDIYSDLLSLILGSSRVLNILDNFKDFFIDPITREILNELNLPTDLVGLMIEAIKLLNNNSFKSEANDDLYRVRHAEIIPCIIYKQIALQYSTYRNTIGKRKMTVPTDCVVKELLKMTTVEDYSTLNPIGELNKDCNISPKGQSGLNLDEAYNEVKRSYTPSMVGKIASATSPDAGVGVVRQLVYEPAIDNMRGFRKNKNTANKKWKDVNKYSAPELSTPNTITHDDTTRTAIACKQSGHMIPLNNARPALISNGIDENMRFRLSTDYVVNAKYDGRIVEIDNETGMVIAEYKPYGNKKYQIFNIGNQIVKNSGGGFYLDNQLDTPLKKGDTFKKDDVLAYHNKFFTYSTLNGLRFNIGPLLKVALYATSENYEDGNFFTEYASNQMETTIVFKEEYPLDINSNIIMIKNIGDHVKIKEYLIQNDTSHEDASINKLLSKLDQDDQDYLLKSAYQGVMSSHDGELVDIKIYISCDITDCSPSIQKLLNRYKNKIDKKNKLINKYDKSPSPMKSGYFNNENDIKVETKYGKIKGIETPILIEFYIAHKDKPAIGDKVVMYSSNKNILGYILPPNYEPFSESNPDEEISCLCSPSPLGKRMLTSLQITIATNRVLVDLKRKLQEIFES